MASGVELRLFSGGDVINKPGLAQFQVLAGLTEVQHCVTHRIKYATICIMQFAEKLGAVFIFILIPI